MCVSMVKKQLPFSLLKVSMVSNCSYHSIVFLWCLCVSIKSGLDSLDGEQHNSPPLHYYKLKFILHFLYSCNCEAEKQNQKACTAILIGFWTTVIFQVFFFFFGVCVCHCVWARVHFQDGPQRMISLKYIIGVFSACICIALVPAFIWFTVCVYIVW